GSTRPAGLVVCAGATAGAAGSMVGGATSIGLDEHAVVNAATPRKTPTDLRKVTRFTSLGNG
ncbi:MAG TPA: hypothetical protein PKI02_13250, partial [Mycobacterium sp.]|nr:hypothetical protein [Mycobacterium sp.]